MLVLTCFGILTLLCSINCGPMKDNERENAYQFLNKIYSEYNVWSNKRALANWNYATNLTRENLEKKLEISSQVASYKRNMLDQVNNYPWQNLRDPDLKRQFKLLTVPGFAVLPEEDYKDYLENMSTMQNIYSTAKICDWKDKAKCDLALEPELTDILAKSRNPEELKHVWTEWRKASGKKVRSMFEKYVRLSNEASKFNNYSDTAAFWLDDYEADDIMEQIESLWQQIRPLYLQIHAYVRYQLNKFYGDDIVSKSGPIPAHLLGNMWSQSWSHISKFSVPYPNKQVPDVSDEMVKQGYDANRMFRLAESCFVSMNMSSMPESFWEKSVFVKPKDRDIVCHASAWDLSDGKDFRIKMCTKVTMQHLMTVHHEMGHIQYYIQYKDQPIIYRGGANPGFHEAVGDVIAMSVSSPNHLQRIGLLKTQNIDDPEVALNDLYFKGLSKIAFLPYAYALDKWRWNVFQGKITADNYNCEWWKLRNEFQGLEPPVDRSEEDFDPGAKYHVVSSVEYLRYFVSDIIQFQFHKALCTEAGEYDPENPSEKPLHSCDITSSTKAGNLFKSMLQMGQSKPWQDAMEKLTGQRKMDAGGLLEYFQPLHDWLKIENEKNEAPIGWGEGSKRCIPKYQV